LDELSSSLALHCESRLFDTVDEAHPSGRMTLSSQFYTVGKEINFPHVEPFFFKSNFNAQAHKPMDLSASRPLHSLLFNFLIEVVRVSKVKSSSYTLACSWRDTEPGDHVLCFIRHVASLCFLFEFRQVC